MNGWQLRKAVVNEELDYLTLKSVLVDYAYPRDKIKDFIKKKVLIRIKKGLYVFGPQYAEQPYSKKTLANLIYGPSAISLEYALAFYGLIPERVTTVTSITNKRNKLFETPAGHFTYQYLNPKKYHCGITQLELDASHRVLIATPEKALADVLFFLTKSYRIENMKMLKEFLFDDMRMDEDLIKKFNYKNLQKIAEIYQNNNVQWLLKYFENKE